MKLKSLFILLLGLFVIGCKTESCSNVNENYDFNAVVSAQDVAEFPNFNKTLSDWCSIYYRNNTWLNTDVYADLIDAPLFLGNAHLISDNKSDEHKIEIRFTSMGTASLEGCYVFNQIKGAYRNVEIFNTITDCVLDETYYAVIIQLKSPSESSL